MFDRRSDHVRYLFDRFVATTEILSNDRSSAFDIADIADFGYVCKKWISSIGLFLHECILKHRPATVRINGMKSISFREVYHRAQYSLIPYLCLCEGYVCLPSTYRSDEICRWQGDHLYTLHLFVSHQPGSWVGDPLWQWDFAAFNNLQVHVGKSKLLLLSSSNTLFSLCYL